jgi:hypothetical protein
MRSTPPAPRGRALVLAAAFAVLAGCASQDRLTADALNCRMGDVNVVPSEFQRRGSETAWCATCKGKLYQCATNAARSRTVCREAKEGDGCL